jgi:hypothetical protein
MLEWFMQLSLYWYVILLKYIEETESMKAESALPSLATAENSRWINAYLL